MALTGLTKAHRLPLQPTANVVFIRAFLSKFRFTVQGIKKSSVQKGFNQSITSRYLSSKLRKEIRCKVLTAKNDVFDNNICNNVVASNDFAFSQSPM